MITTELEEKLKVATKCFWIDQDNLDHQISIEEGMLKAAEGKYTVKFEGLDYMFPNLTESATIHCYISPKGAPSFPPHRDPYAVIIYVLEGTKSIEIEGKEQYIVEGCDVLIPPDVLHRATNKHDSIILSLGFEDGLE
jgi:mannose-6-phosphate isomerase-like protein (cupin superfamily)